MSELVKIDRTAVRRPPQAWPIMYQTWDQLLFLHWPMDAESLRPHIPPGLEIDTWQGTAWIGVTPFAMRGIRSPLTPPLPGISRSYELNVRTYVHKDGVPGVWFFSLDASNSLAVWGARISYSLPYYRAAMMMEINGDRRNFHSVRTHRGAAPAEFKAAWRRGARLPEAVPGTREFFLIERYCLYSAHGTRLYRARIHHRPWSLCKATVESCSSTMIEACGLSHHSQEPLVHSQAEPLRVRVWPPRRIG